MTLRIEFTKTRSPIFARVLSIIRQFPSFKEWESDGMKLYSVEFDKKDFESARSVMDFVRGWRGVAYYQEGQLVSHGTAFRTVWDEIYKRDRRESELNSTYGETPSAFVRIQKRKENESKFRPFFDFGDGGEEQGG
jgi:hypothetical protein